MRTLITAINSTVAGDDDYHGDGDDDDDGDDGGDDGGDNDDLGLS